MPLLPTQNLSLTKNHERDDYAENQEPGKGLRALHEWEMAAAPEAPMVLLSQREVAHVTVLRWTWVSKACPSILTGFLSQLGIPDSSSLWLT